MRRDFAEISVESNLGDFRRLWDRLTDHQLPFATAISLTRTAQSVQDVLRQRLGRDFTVRNNWVARGIQVERASKRDTLARMRALVGSVDEFMGRQEIGGEKRPASARNVAVPVDIRRTKREITRPSK